MSSSSESSDDSPAASPQPKKLLDKDSDDDSDSKSKSSSPVSSRSGGEEETEKVVKKKKVLSDSDSDSGSEKKEKEASDSPDEEAANESPKQRPNKADLFGDSSSSSDDDDDADGEGKKEKEPEKRVRVGSESDGNESVNSIDQLHGIVMQNDEEAEPEEEKERVLHTESVLTSVRTSFGDGPYYVKMPNFLSVSTHPFDPELYEEDEDDEQVKMDEEGRNRLKLRVENTIRWRQFVDENGENQMESNAKFIKWSDGTTSLYLGNEIFEVTMMPLNVNNLPHLYARQPGGMAAQSLLQKRITFRPHSTDSQTHRKVTLNMADRSRKSGQVKVMDDVGHNPELQRREAAKKEEDALRAHWRRTTIARNSFKVRRGMGGNYSDDDEGMTKKSRGKKKEAPIIGASSDESDDEGDKRKSGDDSDSDEEYRKRKQQPKKKTIVTSDEDSD